MGWYDKFLAGTFPDYWGKRRRALAAQNAYEAETQTRVSKPKRTKVGPNQATRTAPRSFRELARHMEENQDIADHALNILVANIVSGGLMPQPMVLDNNGEPLESVNEQIEDLYTRWARHPEVTNTLDDAMAQQLSCRTWLRDGEVLMQHIVGPKSGLTHGLESIAYSYELIEPDLLPLDDEYRALSSSSRALRTSKIRQGIEFNQWNRPVAYHLLKQHPGELDEVMRDSLSAETKRVPADRMSHIKLVKRINQARGVSIFHNVIRRLDDIQEIEESERVAARVAAAIAAVIIKGEPMVYQAPDSDQEGAYREIDIEPGMIFDDLQPGEDVRPVGSSRPNTEIIPFIGAQLKRAAGGLNVSDSSLSKDYDGTYSAQRQELVEQHRLYTPLWHQFVTQSELPKYTNFLRAIQLSGALVLPGNVNRDTLEDVVYTQPVIPWIDPLKEADGWEKLILIGAETKQNARRMRGHNPRQIERQLSREEPLQPQESNGNEMV